MPDGAGSLAYVRLDASVALGNTNGLSNAKGILLITILAVITGLMASGVYQVVSDAITLVKVQPTMIPGAVFIGLMGLATSTPGGLSANDSTTA